MLRFLSTCYIQSLLCYRYTIPHYVVAREGLIAIHLVLTFDRYTRLCNGQNEQLGWAER
jgi:hypothetical protein